MLPNLLLQRFDLAGKLLVTGKELTEVNECPNDLNTSTDRNRTLQNIREHNHAVFGEDVR